MERPIFGSLTDVIYLILCDSMTKEWYLTITAMMIGYNGISWLWPWSIAAVYINK